MTKVLCLFVAALGADDCAVREFSEYSLTTVTQFADIRAELKAYYHSSKDPEVCVRIQHILEKDRNNSIDFPWYPRICSINLYDTDQYKILIIERYLGYCSSQGASIYCGDKELRKATFYLLEILYENGWSKLQLKNLVEDGLNWENDHVYLTGIWRE